MGSAGSRYQGIDICMMLSVASIDLYYFRQDAARFALTVSEREHDVDKPESDFVDMRIYGSWDKLAKFMSSLLKRHLLVNSVPYHRVRYTN
jgi:hypothetical protein